MKTFAIAALVSLAPLSCVHPVVADPTTPTTEPTAHTVRSDVAKATGWDRLPSTTPSGIRLAGKTLFIGVEESASILFDHRGSFILEQNGPIPYTQAVSTIDSAPTPTTSPWLLDLGGETRPLVLGEAEEVRYLAEFISGRWATPSTSLSFTLDPTSTLDKPVLAARWPDTVTTATIAIDAKTNRPITYTLTAGKEHRTITLSGATMLGDIWFPAEIQIAGDAGTPQTITLTEASPAPQFFRSPYEPVRPLGTRPTDVTFDPAAPALLESKRAKSGHALVKVKVDGREGWFIFDTGAGMTVIDAAFADAAQLKPFGDVQAVGVGGAVSSSFVRPKGLTVGPATMTDPIMTRLDLSKIAAALGEQIDGVLGYNLMHRAITRLDTKTGEVRIYGPGFDDKSLTWHKLAVYERHACVEGSFEGHTGWFKLDTGAGTLPVSMHAPAVERLKLLDGRETTESRAGGVGGNVKTRAGTLKWLEVGGRREENVPASFAIEHKGALADPFTLGNLSPRQIGPRDIIFDYAAGRIAFPDRRDPTP